MFNTYKFKLLSEFRLDNCFKMKEKFFLKCSTNGVILLSAELRSSVFSSSDGINLRASLPPTLITI